MSQLNPNLQKRNKAILFILVGLSILFYVLSFVRMAR